LSEEERPTVGRILRKERERKGISLEDVSRVTRITPENLKALEEDDFRAISAPVFARGFLRTYASHLGLDTHEILARYEIQTDLVKAAPKAKEPSAPPRKNGSFSKYLVFLSLIGVGVAAGIYLFQKTPAQPEPPRTAAAIPVPPPPDVQPTPPPSPPAPPLSAPAPSQSEPVEGVVVKAPREAQKPPAATAPKPAIKETGKEEEKPKERRHVLKVVAKEKTWMRVKPDDQPAADVLLQPGETVSWSARRRFDLTIGNAGGLEVSLNGVSQGPLGKSGQVVTLVLPKEARTSEPVLPGESKPGDESKKR
jgi:cytoskeletal protein RodZ